FIAGDTGSGKSAILHDLLCQIAKDRPRPDPGRRPGRGDVLLLPAPAARPLLPAAPTARPPRADEPRQLPERLPWDRGRGQSVIIYDPKLEFWERHGRPELGDVLFHPHYEDCPYFDLADEIGNRLDCPTLATSYVATKENNFWENASQQVLTLYLE